MGIKLRQLATRFDLEGECIAARRFGNGHLQDTRLITMRSDAGEQQVVFQRINTRVFPRVGILMTNMVRATDHLRQALEADPLMGRREVLTVIPARDGNAWVSDDDGGAWRATHFIRGASSHDTVTEPYQVLSASRAFGEFLRLLSDLRPSRLHEVILRFHDLSARLALFEGAVSADASERVQGAADEIAFVRAHTGLVKVLPSLRAPAGLPVRVTHNDTKVNNVLLDDKTNEGICVIDLDTVMPGLSLYDFGDVVRTMTSAAAEDETDLSKVEIDMALFESAAEGWLSEAGPILTEREVKLMPAAGPAMTFMIGVRFLTDHLQGDVYFDIQRSGQNLDRARAQFALLESMEREAKAMKDVVRRIAVV